MAETLIERLDKLAKAAQGRSDNSRVVADYLAPEIKALQGRTGHNIYAARMAVDHRNSARTDAEEAATLRQAATELEALRKRCEAVEVDAARYVWLATVPDSVCEPIQEMWRVVTGQGRSFPRKDEWDSAIDQAIAAAQEPSHG